MALDMIDHRPVRHVHRVVQLLHLPVGLVDVVNHGRRGGDQFQVEFAGQPLLDDLQMQQAEEAAAKAEAQRGGGFRVIVEAGVIEA